MGGALGRSGRPSRQSDPYRSPAATPERVTDSPTQRAKHLNSLNGTTQGQRTLNYRLRYVTIGNMTDMPFTEALQQAIRDSGLPYLQLEQETGVHRASISRFMSGERSLRLDVADKLAAYLGLTAATGKKKLKG